MALTHDPINKAVSNSYGTHLNYRVKLADLVALGAFTSGDITLFTLPAGAIVTRTLVTTVTAVTGVGTAVGYVKTATRNYGSATFDLKAAVSATNRDLYATEQIEIATPVLFHVIVDTTLDAVTAGEVKIAVDYVVL